MFMTPKTAEQKRFAEARIENIITTFERVTGYCVDSIAIRGGRVIINAELAEDIATVYKGGQPVSVGRVEVL